jgi:hypothetical protein
LVKSFLNLEGLSGKQNAEAADRFNFIKQLDQDLITSPKKTEIKPAQKSMSSNSFLIEAPKKFSEKVKEEVEP